jgi:DNA-binding MarR family transcriptional regulator
VRPSRIHDLASTLRLVAAWRSRHSLTANQAEVLLHVYDSGAITSSELSRLVGITTASMTRLVERVESDGWLGRSPDERDRRRVVLRPTKQLARAVDDIEEQLVAEAADGISRRSDRSA